MALDKLVGQAKVASIKLKQTFARQGRQLTRRAAGYAHISLFRRLGKLLKRLHTILG